MKLIIQREGGRVFVYRETEKHFARVEGERRARLARFPVDTFDGVCETDKVSRGDWYVVFDLAVAK